MLLAAALLLLSSIVAGQPASLRIEVQADHRPVAGATVVVAGMPQTTGETGIVIVPVPAGTVRVEVSHPGYLSVTKDIAVTGEPEQPVLVMLIPEPTHEEEITVSATRTDKRLEDQAMRVEVLVREEIERIRAKAE